ncbi:MAG TPA: type II toxin-antitoxin system HicA family toxin [Pirellulales bacterium]|nr:type II toxin-antitoxin system HicA family toxin [Pirellulales bacterium]
MTKLPRISGSEAMAALKKAGFYVKRQKGSHIVMRRDQPFAQTVVPDHRELDSGTLRAIIRQIGMSVDEFQALL